ncbi:hypothetical protein RU93_GL000815 [Enterococcus aquimarinus]|uniref:Uncharacterized protein n=2 Tax=Enterococcus aquimarinus TaxID=328396 RepID=A0A1L8QPB7_9ENTE|nr:hypothetical protein RU93_GL000815 [Enterococcus aquimarinus]
MSHVKGKRSHYSNLSSDINRVLTELKNFDKSKIDKIDNFKLTQLIEVLERLK